tara:strand:+ start:1255 stop:1464 length:210 start_codon:yes stop_codon:yes gene_type:complete
MSSPEEYVVGDLVRLKDSRDKTRQLGIITEIKERVHIKSVGAAAIVMVHWFLISDTDWEYTFFLEKLDR